jgi:hypothetical protein
MVADQAVDAEMCLLGLREQDLAGSEDAIADRWLQLASDRQLGVVFVATGDAALKFLAWAQQNADAEAVEIERSRP